MMAIEITLLFTSNIALASNLDCCEAKQLSRNCLNHISRDTVVTDFTFLAGYKFLRFYS